MKQARKTVYLDLGWKKKQNLVFTGFSFFREGPIVTFSRLFGKKYCFLIADSGPKCFVHVWKWMQKII